MKLTMTINIDDKDILKIQEILSQSIATAESPAMAMPTVPTPVTPATPSAPAMPAVPATPVTPSAPVVPTTPPTAPVAPAAPAVPTAPAHNYTVDELSQAAMTLVDKGMQGQLVALLQQFGVQSLPELSQDQLGAFATAIRGMGALI